MAAPRALENAGCRTGPRSSRWCDYRAGTRAEVGRLVLRSDRDSVCAISGDVQTLRLYVVGPETALGN